MEENDLMSRARRAFASLGGRANAQKQSPEHFKAIGRKGGLAGKGTPRSGRPRKSPLQK